MKKRKAAAIVCVSVAAALLLFWFSPLWDARMILEEGGLLLQPRVERSVAASGLVLKRIEEARGLEGGAFRGRILAAQRMLTAVEGNLGASDKPYKSLRRLQEAEDALRRSKDAAKKLPTRNEEESLLVKHIDLRIDMLLQEVELEKQKNKAQLG